MFVRLFCVPVVLAASLAAVEIPAGTEFHVRLKNKIASNSSKPKDPVRMVVIVPVLAGDRIAIPAGAILEAEIKAAAPAAKDDERALIEFDFKDIRDSSGRMAKVAAKLIEVDNARESVDETGRVLGILASETLTGRIDQGIGRVAQRSATLAGILEAAKAAVLKTAEVEISYDSGVEMTLALTKALSWEPVAEPPQLDPIGDEAGLVRAVTTQPFQTIAEKPPNPSDITNLMFVGSENSLKAAFEAAGWATAAALSKQSAIETFRAIAEQRGYREAPMSTLLLDGQRPDLNYQKQNNTFAMRHHLRIWRRPVTFDGRPVWVCAATHDIGIEFSQENRTFIHKIDGRIDRERAKVVSDFLFSGHVKSLALVDRPAVPRKTSNATGDQIETDGMMAVVILK